MKRLTNEEVRVDESVDRYLGPLADLEGMKPKLLDLILNGPVLNGVSKDVLRQIIRQLYSALAAYEDTGITAEEITATASIPMFVKVTSAALGTTPDHLRELAEADKDGRLVVLPCKVGDTVYFRTYDCNGTVDLGIQPHKVTAIVGHAIVRGRYTDVGLLPAQYGVSWFLTHEEAEKALKATKDV
mgnify:CR=1 FL=1